MQLLQQYYEGFERFLKSEDYQNITWLNDQENLTLIQLSKSLYQISLISQKHQEIEFNPEFVNQLDSNNKQTLSRELIFLHKVITHFILKNKDLNAS